MSFKTIAWMSGGIFWWFPALSEDQETICWIHQNYLVALIQVGDFTFCRIFFKISNKLNLCLYSSKSIIPQNMLSHDERLLLLRYRYCCMMEYTLFKKAYLMFESEELLGFCNEQLPSMFIGMQCLSCILYELKFSRWFYFRKFRESNPRENFHFNLCLFKK